ncbi:MAG: amino acid ABC transporter substrate-binding protein [Hormoscilla sp. SP12CHS1]|nr:amino acid ABC transporter substrate-binding protein [Hormoscilla sp. SP12CHS1]
MNQRQSWTCDGVPKDGNPYPHCSGPHEPYENYGPDCVMCGLPREAVEPKGKQNILNQKTFVSRASTKLSLGPIALVAVLIILAGGVISLVADRMLKSIDKEGITTSAGFVSEKATNKELFSQGEKILLDETQLKLEGASEFAQQQWQMAQSLYQQASDARPNDPEGKIYLQNAIARKAGNPLTIAVVVPITASADSAKEVLRGVAQYQAEYNQSPSASVGRLLEVVVVNDMAPGRSASIAQDLVNANVLGVLGHGIDPGSQQALRIYNVNDLAVLSPLTTSVTSSGKGRSTLKTIAPEQKSNELLGSYLQAVGKTLAEYAKDRYFTPAAVVFYNSDSPYSEQLQQELVQAIGAIDGKVVSTVDVLGADFDAATAIARAKRIGANIGFLALSKNKVSQAVALAQANANRGPVMTLLGGDELYNPTILVEGGKAIESIVLAVPWSFQPGDPFAKDALTSWKGRVSWRTATAYDATKVLAAAVTSEPSRSGASRLLNGGLAISSNTDFNIFEQVPLVLAVPGTSGPVGSNYQFDPIP